MGQSKPRPSRDFGLKSYAPMRSETRPQWFVRPPSARDRHHMKFWSVFVRFCTAPSTHAPSVFFCTT